MTSYRPSTQNYDGLMAHLSTAELTERIASLPPAPTGSGRVELMIVRPGNGARKTVDQAHVVPGKGIVGDNYIARGSSSTPDGEAHPEAQICMMNAAVLDVIADGDRELWPLAGDQLLVDFDLSITNIPAGTRFTIGSATFEVSNKPHTGCAKFAGRFGIDAARFANSDKVQRYRGINLMVVTEGDVTTGDTITKLAESGTGAYPPA